MSFFELAELLFGLRRPVSRGVYARAGFGLLVLRYGVDFALSAKFAQHALDPFSYLNPVLAMRLDALGKCPSWLPVLMAVWALPFIWVGVSMTARRLADAGKSPWLALLFFVPAVNYLLMSPGWYWGLYADEIVHVIHLRVLKHIRGLSEASR